jgi:phosphopantetheinyl transferase
MPVFKKWSDERQTIVIWHITEPESFFTEQLSLATNIKNENRRLEFFVGRFLLKQIVPDFPIEKIEPDVNDKPRIPHNDYFFSISHSFPFVAVAVSHFHECGIDLQTWRPNMQLLQHKFLSHEEQVLFKNDEQLLTLAWCAKEAAYKWNGKRGVDFIHQLPIKSFNLENLSMEIAVNNAQNISLKGGMEQNFAWMSFSEEQ